MWEARVDGLRSTLTATEQHSKALEEELAMRPTQAHVGAEGREGLYVPLMHM